MKKASGEDIRAGARPWRLYLTVVLLLYGALQVLYIGATPLEAIALPDNLPVARANRPLLVGLGPDEKEHFLYLLSIADGGVLPVPTPAFRTSPLQYVTYQAQHPPLFYAVGAALYRLTPFLSERQFWYLLRVFCALCGVGIIVLAAHAARIAFPDRAFVWWGIPPAIAFLPMFAHMTANVSNEPLAMLFGAWAWLQVCRIARRNTPVTTRDIGVLGLTLGLATLTRLTALLWLIPAVLVVLCDARQSNALIALRRALVGVAAFGALPALWLLHNRQAFGQFLIRPFSRPMLQSVSLGQYLSDPMQTLHIVSGGVETRIVIPPLMFTLWCASSAAVPYWLIQFYLPNFPQASAAWQALFLLFDVVVLLLLFLHASAARRDTSTPPDAAGRLLLWSAGAVVGACVLALVQQQLYSDWDVIYSAGRYLVAFVPASTLVALFALSTRLPKGRLESAGVAAVFVFLLALDLYCGLLVRRFYGDHPSQPSVQPIAACLPAISLASGRGLG